MGRLSLEARRLEEFKERCENDVTKVLRVLVIKIGANMMNLASLAPKSFDGNCKRRVIDRN